ncbi:MAG: DUF6455 family protein [Woeseia sp.]
MNATFSDFGIAILLVGIAVILVMWFRGKLRSESRSRMDRMMARLGVDPDKLADAPTDRDMNAVRTRCRRCPAEDVCERWLAGEIEGDNGFCPNAKIFDGVVKAT